MGRSEVGLKGLCLATLDVLRRCCEASAWTSIAGHRENTAEQPERHPRVALKLPSSCPGGTVEVLWSCSMVEGMVKAATRENQVKLTVSVPPSVHVLLRSWALCEGRELTSVVLQCVELSVRQMKSNGSIPAAAIRAYDDACEERLAVGGL